MTKRISILSLLFASIGLHAEAINEKSKPSTQPPFPRVYRSVLDKEPRQLSYRITDNVAISYDTWHCRFSCAWVDPEGKLIDLSSAVHNGNHGPQPTRLGKIAFSNNSAEYTSKLGKIQYLGHRYLNQTLTLMFGIKDKDGNVIASIFETPSYKNGTLTRKTTVVPATAGKDITFTPASKATWSLGTKPFTTAPLSAPITITTSLK